MMDIKKTIKKLFSDSDDPTHPDFGDIFGEGDFIPNEDEFVGLEQQIRTPSNPLNMNCIGSLQECMRRYHMMLISLQDSMTRNARSNLSIKTLKSNSNN